MENKERLNRRTVLVWLTDEEDYYLQCLHVMEGNALPSYMKNLIRREILANKEKIDSWKLKKNKDARNTD